jgi:hypothetical protein
MTCRPQNGGEHRFNGEESRAGEMLVRAENGHNVGTFPPFGIVVKLHRV